MSISRRNVLLAGLGVALTGCAASTSRRVAAVPAPIWPTPNNRLSAAPAAPARPPRTYTPRPAASTGLIQPRSAWTRTGLSSNNINPMNGVNRLTIHHEGWTPVAFTAAAATFERIEKIRQIHTRDRGWADIGYHYIVDRAGRVIEGRDLRYQGAHVSQHNEHNLGILVLGNFEEHTPSQAQVDSLARFVRTAVQRYSIPASRVMTHQEINPTQCPGRYLQSHINQLRRTHALT